MPPLRRFAGTWISSLVVVQLCAALPCRGAESLKDAPSEYVRTHADDPVQWQAWGDAAFARAKAEDKPVFLVIGSAMSELSRAMHRQSFGGKEVSAFLNANFVCVLVDRDERPDLAALYQSYVREAKQLTGWPLNIWLTPELKPIDGATYLPPTEEWGKEGFFNAAKRVAAAWKADPAAQRRNASDAVGTVTEATRPPAPDELTQDSARELLASAAKAWRDSFDATHGAFGDPPRYPEPELLRFMLRADDASRDAALAVLRAMATSPLRDPLDGGFFRYAIDASWRVPYLQKSAADQARIALAYFDAAQVSHDDSLAAIGRAALDYALARLAQETTGAFVTAEDATLPESSGFYAWTAQEIQSELGDAAAEFIRAHGVRDEGNVSPDDDAEGHWKGKNILSGPIAAGDAMRAARGKLLAVRDARKPAPIIHDNVSAGANGLMLAALSRAAIQTKDARYLEAARRTGSFLRDRLIDDNGHRLHTLPGSAAVAGPTDYAQVVAGLLELHAATGAAEWRDLAAKLQERNLALHFDATTGRFFATTTPLVPGFWARLPAPSPSTGEPPSPETLSLLTLEEHPGAIASSGAAAEILAREVAQEIRDGPPAARGDLLLALQSVEWK